MILISLVITVFSFGPKNKSIASPLEIRFYNEYLVVFREKMYYSRKISRKEYNKFYYLDISKIVYNHKLKKFNISGKIDAMWFDYNQDGSIPEKPTYHRIVDGGLCYFYVNGNDEEFILKCLEEYTGKQAIVLNKPEEVNN